jgi:hypothetical protein
MRIWSQLSFGKHVGLTLDEVPNEYLRWLHDRHWLEKSPRLVKLRAEIHACLVEVHCFPPDWESSSYDDDDEAIRWDRKYG